MNNELRIMNAKEETCENKPNEIPGLIKPEPNLNDKYLVV